MPRRLMPMTLCFLHRGSKVKSDSLYSSQFNEMARPGRVELPTLCLEGRRSFQLSYGRLIDSKRFRVLATIHLSPFVSNGVNPCFETVLGGRSPQADLPRITRLVSDTRAVAQNS
jgi:hypothetical protein